MPSVRIGERVSGPQNEMYVITDFLGRGAFGEVYRATGESTGAVIAVKLLPLGEFADETPRIALLNEIKAARQISHPNVVRVLHVNEGDIATVGPYACMEYVSGGTLASLLRVQVQTNSQISIARALEMMIDIAQGARAINEKLIHRDIKPDNILIEGKVLKIGDFGISKFVDESTRLHSFKGGQHIAYMAPEGWACGKNTFKLDVYAVGLVFFEILTTKHPLIATVPDPSNFLDWQKAHLYQACPDLRSHRTDAPLSLAQLISRMAAKRPQQRPDWEETLKILSDPAIDAPPTSSSTISQAVTLAVASAVAKQQELEKRKLQYELERAESERHLQLHEHSCDALLGCFQPTVDQFNHELQTGEIKVFREAKSRRASYTLPTGREIQIEFFPPTRTGTVIREARLIGGAFIGLLGGRSANLVLQQESSDDLYGRWSVCEITIGLGDPRRLIGQFGITPKTVEPFGFGESGNFYDQIQFATGCMHVFNYNFNNNVEEYFATLIVEGCR